MDAFINGILKYLRTGQGSFWFAHWLIGQACIARARTLDAEKECTRGRKRGQPPRVSSVKGRKRRQTCSQSIHRSHAGKPAQHGLWVCPETRLQMPHSSISAFLGTNHSHQGRLGCNLTSMLCVVTCCLRCSHLMRKWAAIRWNPPSLQRGPRENMYYIISIGRVSQCPQLPQGSDASRLMSSVKQAKVFVYQEYGAFVYQ